MSKRDQGSIDITAAGKHRVRVRVRGKRTTVGTFGTRAEAEKQLAEALDIVSKEAPAVAGVTLAEFGDDWLTKREIARDIRDPQTDWSRWRTHIAKTGLAKMPMKSVRYVHVEQWLAVVRKKVARQTALNTLQLVRSMFRQAIREQLVKQNPCDEITLPKQKRTENPWTFLIPEEQIALIEAFEEQERPLVRFAIGTGLRAGELVTLRLVDVHVDPGSAHVVVRYGTAPDIATKTGKIRNVPLFGLGLAAAKEWLANLSTYAPKNPSRLMFPGTRGGFRSEAHVVRWPKWKAALKKAGLTRRVRWHDLRHTCASSLVSGWWSRAWTLMEVKEMLGHASITTTERYAHLGGTALQLAAGATTGPRPILEPTPKTDTKALVLSGGAPETNRTSGQRFRKTTRPPVLPRGLDDKGPPWTERLNKDDCDAHGANRQSEIASAAPSFVGAGSVAVYVDDQLVGRATVLEGDTADDVADKVIGAVAKSAPITFAKDGPSRVRVRRAGGAS